MGLNVNKFSSRILPSRDHTPLEAIVIMIFFLLILGGLGVSGYHARMGAIVYLYAFAGFVVCVGLFVELYFVISNWFSKNENHGKSSKP